MTRVTGLDSGRWTEESSRQPVASAIAVIIPTYNRETALITCLEHLERQSWADFEVVVVDDGSTDGTARAIEEYLARTPLRLRCVRQENAGPGRARNLALGMVGAAVCLTIGDDIFGAPGLVEAHLRLHREHREDEVVGLGLTRWSEAGQTVTPFMRWLDEAGVQFAYHDLLRGARPNWTHFYTSNLSFKTAYFRRNAFNELFTGDQWMMEDVELGYRLERRHGLKMMFVPEALAEHLHPTTFTKTCERFYGAGLSSQLFDRLWPERRPAPTGVVRRWMGAFVRWNGWILVPLRLFTEVLTRFWCPNPLLRPVLALYASMGYRHKREQDKVLTGDAA